MEVCYQIDATKTIIYEMFSQGKTYKEIAVAINSNAFAVNQRIQRYRKKEPNRWPRLRHKTKPLKVKVGVYHCGDCQIYFAVEHTEDPNDITCPYCWKSEKLADYGFSYIKVRELENS